MTFSADNSLILKDHQSFTDVWWTLPSRDAEFMNPLVVLIRVIKDTVITVTFKVKNAHDSIWRIPLSV